MHCGCLCRNTFQTSTHLSTRSCASKHLHHDRKFHGLILHHGVHPVSMRLQPRPPDVPRSRPSFLASAFVRANAFDRARITNVLIASCRRKAHETGEVAVVAASSPSRLEKDDVPTSPIAVRTAFDLSWFRPPSFGSRAVHGKARFVRSSDVPWRCKEHVCASDAQRMERTAAAVGGLQVPPLETFPVEDPLSCPSQLEDGRDPLRVCLFPTRPGFVRHRSEGRSGSKGSLPVEGFPFDGSHLFHVGGGEKELPPGPRPGWGGSPPGVFDTS
eukprot:scaffold541_cov335-Pavlova_lutheri.AAC.11